MQFFNAKTAVNITVSIFCGKLNDFFTLQHLINNFLLNLSGGSVTKDGILGFEFSGRTADGRRVMGIVANKGMATSVIANPLLLWDVPEEWSLKEAATIPVVYTTAYYALVLRGRLKKGERILIHSGSGGVGQAAITIALSMGCDVYTTVGKCTEFSINSL